MIATLGAIALGGALGALSRHGVNVGAAKIFGFGFPWGTMIANILGCFLMGVIIARFAQMDGTSPELRSFIVTGFLGAFTTFSTFSLDFVTMYERGDILHALMYMGASVILGITALFAGSWLIRGIFA